MSSSSEIDAIHIASLNSALVLVIVLIVSLNSQSSLVRISSTNEKSTVNVCLDVVNNFPFCLSSFISVSFLLSLVSVFFRLVSAVARFCLVSESSETDVTLLE